MENNNSASDYLDDPKKYFTTDEWSNMSDYAKIRIKNTYDFYLDMIKSGFKAKKPDFMSKFDKKINEKISEKQEIISKLADLSIQKEKIIEPKIIQQKEAKSQARYPKRNIPVKNYTEHDLISDDRYIYCDICMNEFIDKCSIHELIHIPDNPVPLTPKNPNRARETVPKGWLNICSSKISNGGEGVWTLKTLDSGFRFGPYEGNIIYEEVDSQYSWQIKKNGKVVSYIDGADTSISNWMRFVNCARNKAEQNLVAFQYLGKIYYRTVEKISPGTELLVFYGTDFAKELGIDTKNYNLALETPLEDNVFQCENCGLAFSSPIYLDSHVSRCRERKIVNPPKKPTKQNEKAISKNIGDFTNSGFFKCHLCDKAYTIKSFYNHHLMIKHCLYDYNPENDLNNQENIKQTANSMTNSSSSTTIDSGYNDELMKSTTVNRNKRRHKCTECHKAFHAPSHLENHIRIHTGERPFQCNICYKSFNDKGCLKEHKHIHEEKSFKCDICYKAFRQLQVLRQHKRTHSNERPHICTICQKTFKFPHTLTTHIRIHTGEKPYKCTYCQKAFSQLCNLKTHKKSLHKDQE